MDHSRRKKMRRPTRNEVVTSFASRRGRQPERPGSGISGRKPGPRARGFTRRLEAGSIGERDGRATGEPERRPRALADADERPAKEAQDPAAGAAPPPQIVDAGTAHEPGLASGASSDKPGPESVEMGRYALVRRVGAGGMAEVWKAKAYGPAGFEKVVAIKRILPSLSAEREFVSMFVEEAKLVARLEHPNIVQVFDFGRAAGGEYFLAMEFVAGQDLATVLERLAERKRTMPIDLAMHVAAEVAAALAYAHDAKDALGRPISVVHRDVSPHNVLVTYRGEVKVTDFGIAKVASALPRTASGVWKGKVAYMSPEQATLRPLDARSDLFSLGLVLYELCTGERLFKGTAGEEIYARITSFRADDAELSPVHGDARPIVRKALQIDPANRYADARSMEAALADALGRRGGARAKAALAALMQELFEEEREADSAEPGVPEAAAGAAPGGGTHEQCVMTDPHAPPPPDGQRCGEPPRVPRSRTEIFEEAVQDAEEDEAIRTTIDGRPHDVSAGGSTRIGRHPRTPAAVPPAPTPNLAARPMAEAPFRQQRRPRIGRAMAFLARVPRTARLARGISRMRLALAAGALVAGVLAGRALFGDPAPQGASAIFGAMSGAMGGRAAATAAPSPTPEGAPASPTPTARPSASPVASVLAAAPTPVAGALSGSLSVLGDPRADVWVNGARVAAGRPLRNLSLPPGKHTLRVVNDLVALDRTVTVPIGPGEHVTFYVNVANRTVGPR